MMTLLLCMKIGFPSANDCPASEFSCMDFDSDEEFIVFHSSKLPLSHILLYAARTTVFLLELWWLFQLLFTLFIFRAGNSKQN